MCNSQVAAQLPEEIDHEREYTVKAANLYSLGFHTEWPAHQHPAALAFRIAVVGEDPFQGKLERVAKAKKNLHNLPMQIEHFAATDEVGGCQMIFIPAGTEAQTVQDLLQQARHAATMVVGETPRFAESGGDANLLVEHGKIKLELNVQSLARKKIRPSAQLLKIATIVQESKAVTQNQSK